MIRFLPVLVSLAPIGCSGIDVSSDYDPATDFAAFSTYAWLSKPAAELPGSPLVSELLLERVRHAVDSELSAKGMRVVPEEAASLLVTEHLSIEERIQFNDPYYSFDMVQTYEEGTLLIDLVDADSRELLWRGIGQTRLRELPTPEEREQRVQEVVSAILAQYPPKGGT